MAGKTKISRNYLDMVYVPRQDLEWREKEDGRIEVDMEHTGIHHRIAQKFFHRPRISHIALDQYGSVLWKGMDGKLSVYELVLLMQEKFPEEQDRMLDRVVTFMRTLERNHFVQVRKEL